MITLSKFNRAFINAAESAGKRILVLRNYHGLPDQIYTKDIDMLILHDELSEWRELLSSLCSSLGLVYKQGPSTFTTRQNYIGGIDDRARALQIDLMTNLNWYGVQYLSVEEVFAKAIPYNAGIWIPHPAHECIITFCQGYFYCGHIKTKYLSSLAAQIKAHSEEVLRLLANVFGEVSARRILAALVRQDPAELLDGIMMYRARALARAFVQRPFSVLHDGGISGLMRFNVYLNNRVSKLLGHGGNERFANNT